MKVLQVVPNLPPNICGVGDYSISLALELKRLYGVETEFLVANTNWQHGESIGGFSAKPIRERTATALAAELKQAYVDAVILQYTGYGYEKRGVPWWLVAGLYRTNKPLLTMFHELFANGPITSSAFWLSFAMRHIARKIAQRSQRVVTNRKASSQWLGNCSQVLPVLSNFGEPAEVISWDDKLPWLVAFPYQSAISRDYWRDLERVLRTLRVERLLFVGKSVGAPPLPELASAEITGILPAGEIAQLLAQSKYGFASYYSEYLGKSGILAALAAYGVAVALCTDHGSTSDGIELGRHVIDPTNIDSRTCWQDCAGELQQWYLPHNLTNTARYYRTALQQLCS